MTKYLVCLSYLTGSTLDYDRYEDGYYAIVDTDDTDDNDAIQRLIDQMTSAHPGGTCRRIIVSKYTEDDNTLEMVHDTDRTGFVPIDVTRPPFDKSSADWVMTLVCLNMSHYVGV